jgi:hypothetical protein
MLPGSGNRPRYTTRREPETPRGYERREYEEERGPRGRGKSVSLPMSLKFDGKSNWKAFYAKFSRYAEVSKWTGSLLVVYLGLFPLPGNMGVYEFLPPGPSGSPSIERDCPLSFSPSYSSLLWMLLGVSCPLPGF